MPVLSPSRRDFLKTSATLVGGACALTLAEDRAGTAAAVASIPVRRKLDPTKPYYAALIAQYAEGVRLMKHLPAGAPASSGWIFQANIHGNPNTSVMLCQHQNWFFLPWHRMYLYHFERIMRTLLGDPMFALPYWDWTDASTLTMAAEFRDAMSPLYDGHRSAFYQMGGSLSPSYFGPGLMTYLMRQRTFPEFGGWGSSGALELGPHNTVHRAIAGGSGVRDMGDNYYAARDPIFWMHHSNVDRLWDRWLAQSATPAHRNPSQSQYPQWSSQRFGFRDESGSAVNPTVAEILAAAPLSYRYDDSPNPVPALAAGGAMPEEKNAPKPRAAVSVAVGAIARHILKTVPYTLPLPLPRGAEAQVQAAIKAEPGGPVAVVLRVEEIAFGKDSASVVEVYLQNGEEKVDLKPFGPHFAGYFAEFDPQEHQAHQAVPHAPGEQAKKEGAHPAPNLPEPKTPGTTASFDVSEVIQHLEKAKNWDGGAHLHVTLVPQTLPSEKEKTTGEITFKRVVLLVR